jgi:hypothetical protein
MWAKAFMINWVRFFKSLLCVTLFPYSLLAACYTPVPAPTPVQRVQHLADSDTERM